MIVKAFLISDFAIRKMAKNSLLVENKQTGETMFIHRNVFNVVNSNPELPLFRVEKNFNGRLSVWLAAPMTI